MAEDRADELKNYIEAGLAAGLESMDDAQSRQIDASRTVTVSTSDKIADVHKKVGAEIFIALDEETTVGSYVLQQLGEFPVDLFDKLGSLL